VTAVDAVAPDLGATQACRVLGISRATLYRRRRPPVSTARPSRARPPRALSDAERQTVRAVLHSERFCDTAPAEVVATLLDEGTYLASERTMYRVQAQAGQTGDPPMPSRPATYTTRWDATGWVENSAKGSGLREVPELARAAWVLLGRYSSTILG
jgi:hypothetical protein